VSEAPEPQHRFIADCCRNPINRVILERLPTLGLGQAYLVAGCLFQTVWNVQTGRPPTESIKDYDIFYFDGGDLSWEAEDVVIRRTSALFSDLPAPIEIRNQARVHLWYEQHFGVPCPQLASARDGIDRFLIPCTCVGIAPAAGGSCELYAPYGLAELYAGVLRENPLNAEPHLFRAKAASYRKRWPWLTIR
jgi:hypothetical protein